MAARAQTKVPRGAAGVITLVRSEDFTDQQSAKVERARDAGIVNPVWAMQAALWADIPYFILCAYLVQETAGGENVWGSDDTWMRGIELRDVGLREVTEDTYKVYRRHRDRFGNQGVGPMQLTHPTFQNRGDQLGGTWKPLPNMLAAVEWLRARRDEDKEWHTIARLYNGSEAYAVHNDELRAIWKEIIL